MRWIKSFFDFYIQASIHVSIAVLSLIAITAHRFSLDLSSDFYFFVFCGSVTGYNFVKYAGVAGLHHRSLTRSLRAIQFFSFLAFMGLLLTAYFLPRRLLLFCIPPAIFTFLYAVPFIAGKNLRRVSGLKIFVIAAVWSWVTVILPVVAAGASFTSTVILFALQLLLFVTVLTLPFEIRDLRFDVQALGTIPQRFGLRTTKILGLSGLLFFYVLFFFHKELSQELLIAAFMSCVVLGILLWKSTTDQSKYFAAFWVEAIPVLWYLSLLLIGQFLV
ncbi:hypothetical protein [Croceiramulus getboli]|nr:hypothetical protein P8624_07255 [Flavobacteriaceae bacterium YJPT1-3]